MISFTDSKLYVKGTCQAILSDPCTAEILYASNKFQTANITTSVSMGEIRAGLGNSIATILPSDSALNVEFTAADFSLFAKAAQVGATLSYSAPAPVCKVITASGTSLSVGTDDGIPVAQAGFDAAYCYVQTVGSSGTVAQTGTPYPISAAGAITGFTSVASTKYKVFYWVTKETAQIATISSLMDPKVLHFTAQMAVFSNENCTDSNEGTRVGWLYVIVPRLKLGANAGVVGDQTTADTTSLSGQAIAFDDSVISETCTDCAPGDLAYYIYVPDDGADQIQGLAVVGGAVSLAMSSTAQIPVRFVMANGQLVIPASYSSGFTYDMSTTITGASVSSAGVITSGTTAGDGEVTITYDNGGTDITCPVNVTVTA